MIPWLLISLAVVLAFLLYLSWRELDSIAQKVADMQRMKRLKEDAEWKQRQIEIKRLRDKLDSLSHQCAMSDANMRRTYDSRQTCLFCQCENRTCAGFVRHAGTAEVLRERPKALTAEKEEQKS